MEQKHICCTVVWRGDGVGIILNVKPGQAEVRDNKTGLPRWMSDAELAVVDDDAIREAQAEALQRIINGTRAKAFPT